MIKRIFLTIAALTAMCGLRAAEANYIFLFIGDGMGPGAVMAAQNYLQAVTENPDTTLTMLQLPVASMCTTQSASSPVTDSCAAGTALATGSKTTNGFIGMLPDSTATGPSVARQLQAQGFGVGLVTTCAADDATPAAFYANALSRNDYLTIGRQAAASGFDFIGGAGLRGFSDKEGRPTGLASDFARHNYSILRGKKGLEQGARGRRIVWLGTDTIHPYRLGYSIEPSANDFDLVDLTEAAIAHMERNGKESFFIMVEGGTIDHAGHANDAATSIQETLTFDRALARAVEFYRQHPEETLIVVTADHETGGMALGNNATPYMTALGKLKGQKMSKDTFANLCREMAESGQIMPWAEMTNFLAENFGIGETIALTERQAEKLRRSYFDTFNSADSGAVEALYNKYPRFVVDLFELIDSQTGMGWTSIHHTGNPVPVYAVGVGADRFNGMIDNTDVPGKILEIVETFSDRKLLLR